MRPVPGAGGFAGRSQPRLIAATVAEVSRTRSAGASSISSPRRPAEQKTVSKATAEASTTVRSVYEYGCTAQLSAVDAADDGSYSLVTTGVERFRVLSADLAGAPYPTGEVEILIDTPGEDADSLRTPATAQFLGYQRALSGLRGVRVGPLPQLPDDPTVLSYLIAATMIIDLREKHSLLAAADTATRLRREQALLRREALLIQELRSLPAVDLLKRD